MAHSSPSSQSDHRKSERGSARATLAARPLACFLGLFSLVNIIAALHAPSFDANLWWIDCHPLPSIAAHVLLCTTSLVLLLFALKPHISYLHIILRPLLVVLLLIVLGDSVRYYLLITRHVIHSGAPVPFSVLVFLALLLVLLGRHHRKDEAQLGPHARPAMLLIFLGCLVALPLAQIYCFGVTDYRRPADAIVVFGARAYADGAPSRTLAERVATACRLYHAGYAPVLVCSGGPGDGDIPEPQAMRWMAQRLGVPASAILTDMHGLNTHQTVNNTCLLFTRRHLTRIIAVSHFYHLPRIKMTYQRAGWDVYTVPAEEHGVQAGDWYPVLREVVALWGYYLSG